MPERQPPRLPDNETAPPWPMEQLADQFDADLDAVADPAFGTGQRLRIGPERQLSVELYPDAGTIRLTLQHGRVELFQQPVPVLQDDLLLFSRNHGDEEIQLAIDEQGLVALRIQLQPLPATRQEPFSAVSDAEREPDPSPAERSQEEPSSTLQDDALTRIETANDESVETEETDGTKETQPRLTITGRLGRNPHFRTTRNNTLVASFPVAVLEEDGSTSWHRVVAFRERAEQLRDQLKSGDRVEVIGYLHERERQTRDGSPRTVEELYAAVIKPR